MTSCKLGLRTVEVIAHAHGGQCVNFKQVYDGVLVRALAIQRLRRRFEVENGLAAISPWLHVQSDRC